MSFSSGVMILGFPPEVQVPPPVINILFLMNKIPSLEAVEAAAQRVLFFDRFRSVVKMDSVTGDSCFEEVKDFNVRKIIKTRDVNNEKELHFEIDRISKSKLDDMSKLPPWALHLISNTSGGLCGLVVRVHHVIGDGLSIAAAFEKLFEELEPGSAAKLEEKINSRMRKQKKSSGIDFAQLISSVGGFFEVAGLPLSSYDSDIKFSFPNKPDLKMTSNRSIVFFPSLHLDFIKAIKSAAGVTVNDVMYVSPPSIYPHFSFY